MIGRPHVVHVLTVADSLVFIDTLVARTLARGFDVTVVTSPHDRLREFGKRHGVATVDVEMPRRVTPMGDWSALQSLYRLFSSLKPRIVHAHTPKGGLLGTLASRAASVPVRLYHMRGLPFVTQRGAMAVLMQCTERLACAAATRVICQSNSLRETAVAAGVVSTQKSTLVLGGSNGVDAELRFNPSRHGDRRDALRRQWRIPRAAVVVGFVGRVVHDKGVPELLTAFDALSRRRPDAYLIVAGPLEQRDAIDATSRNLLENHPNVRALGFTDDTPGVYAACDLVVLPSHREGFPNVPLEAAAMGLPVVTTRVAGCVDAVEDGQTGALVPPADPRALEAALMRYVESEALRSAHGSAGRSRVLRLFRRDAIAEAIVDLYEEESSRALA